MPHGARDITQDDKAEFAQWTPPIAQRKGDFAPAPQTAQHCAAEIELPPPGPPIAQGAPREERLHEALDLAIQICQLIGREFPVNPDVGAMAIGLSGVRHIGWQRLL